ncbi:MAG: glycosyltransferase [Candidatus Coatesbacteria bacterium]|nr:MAG: glycosyltransferase [Candidatus Coatesbacteria bacterium]
MKIVLYLGQLDVGGAEGQALLLARGLRARGHDLLLVTEEGRLGAVPPDLLAAVAEVPRRPRRARLGALREILAAARADVLHCQLPVANLWGTIAGRGAGVPVVIISFLSTDPWKKWYHRLADRYASRRADGLWCNSRGVAELYGRRLGRAASKIRLIYNGVDLDRFDPGRHLTSREETRRAELHLPAGARLVVNVANLYAVKNHQLLLRALGRLHAELAAGARPHLLLLGEGPEKANILAEAGRLGLLPYLRLLGSVADVERYLAAADVFVLSSEAEGFSNALLEAMASGLACLASDVGGNAEALAGGAGIVFPRGDEVALTAALRGVLENDRRREELAVEARRRAVEKFGLERMIAETEGWYEELRRR